VNGPGNCDFGNWAIASHCLLPVGLNENCLSSNTMPIDDRLLANDDEIGRRCKGIYETLKHSVRSFTSLTTIPQ
jgi:hypothetical protein